MLSWPPGTHERFDAICHLVGRQRRGFSMRDLAAAARPAEVLGDLEPDQGEVESLLWELGLEVDDLDGLPRGGTEGWLGGGKGDVRALHVSRPEVGGG